MGRINTVNLLGIIPCEISYKKSETLDLQSVSFPLHVSRRKYANESNELSGEAIMSTPMIISRNKDIMEKMIKCGPGDMVLVKGNLCTRSRNKVFRCPPEGCGYEEVKDKSIIIYVDPVFVYRIGHRDVSSQEEMQKTVSFILKELPEISNQVLIEGRVCWDPDYFEDPSRKYRMCEYVLAVNRLRRIREDEIDKDTDYPPVRSFGKVALTDKDALRRNSLVTINGAIQTRRIEETHTCKRCGMVYKRKGMATEIVPYNVEYRENCRKPESTRLDTGESDE